MIFANTTKDITTNNANLCEWTPINVFSLAGGGEEFLILFFGERSRRHFVPPKSRSAPSMINPTAMFPKSTFAYSPLLDVISMKLPTPVNRKTGIASERMRKVRLMETTSSLIISGCQRLRRARAIHGMNSNVRAREMIRYSDLLPMPNSGV